MRNYQFQNLRIDNFLFPQCIVPFGLNIHYILFYYTLIYQSIIKELGPWFIP
jgi:hypothetical protein